MATVETTPIPEPTFTPDTTATWEYWSLTDPSSIPDEWVWERLRIRRNQLLAATDWRMVADAVWDTTVWAAYRAELRDLPQNTTDPRQAVWPEPPA